MTSLFIKHLSNSGIVIGCWVCSLPRAGKNSPFKQNINEHGNVKIMHTV
jgi:hypothetical protein